MASAAASPPPQRVVSLDYCADQYVLGLLPRSSILAVSFDADADYSFFRARAEGLRQVSGSAESVIALSPDLVVRSYGGGPRADAFFGSLGLEVVNVPYAGSVEETKSALLTVARALSAEARADAAIAALPATAAPRASANPAPSALYMTPGGVTAGQGTFIESLFSVAGLSTYERRTGWHDLPLEALLRAPPRYVVRAFTKGRHGTAGPWSAARHGTARALWTRGDAIDLDAALTACPAWFSLTAIDRLREGAP